MVYIVITTRFPAIRAEDAGKAFFEVMNKFSNLYREGKPAKRIVGLMSTEDGSVATTIWEVTGTFIEASIELSKLYLELAKKIEGSSMTSKTYLSIMESLPVIGMTPPK
ncbi:MAG: hypothetical protein ACFE94_12360 [Candidatus Hodarchaeota archaeon]